jgi:hypothetical protein
MALSLMVSKETRRYWLPGVGTFGLRFPDEETAVIDQVDKLTSELQVKVKPQACTRGLPRPDRRPIALVSAQQRRQQSA